MSSFYVVDNTVDLLADGALSGTINYIQGLIGKKLVLEELGKLKKLKL